MADPAPAEGEDAPKKKGGAVKVIIIAVVMLAVGAGGAFGAVQMGLIGPPHEVKIIPKGPQLIKKGEEDPYAPKKAEGEGEGEGGEDVEGEGGSEFRTAYYSFEEPFTSNLKDSSTLIQTSLAASTRRDGRVLMWVKKHELAIRSAILVALADTPEDDIFTPAGKDRLQKRLTATINKELIAAEGFGGIDKVYFKGLLVQ